MEPTNDLEPLFDLKMVVLQKAVGLWLYGPEGPHVNGPGKYTAVVSSLLSIIPIQPRYTTVVSILNTGEASGKRNGN